MVREHFEMYIYEIAGHKSSSIMVGRQFWNLHLWNGYKCTVVGENFEICLSEMAENSPQFILNTLFFYKKPVYKKLGSKDQKIKKLFCYDAKKIFEKF